MEVELWVECVRDGGGVFKAEDTEENLTLHVDAAVTQSEETNDGVCLHRTGALLD